MSELKEIFPLPAFPPLISTEDEFVVQEYGAQLFSRFFSTLIEKSGRRLEEDSPRDLKKMGEDRALEVFQAAAQRVPAYKDFLKKNSLNPKKITSIEEFGEIPSIDKDNYLKQYTLQELSWDGNIASSQMIAVSSGSSGNPSFWPRGLLTELETTYIFELFLRTIFKAHEKTTLFVNAFAMGMYVGGPITLNATLRIAQKGYPITVVTPGYSLDDILRVIQELGGRYDQIVLASYPPLAKDVIDEGIKHGINWRKNKMRFLLAGEGYNESWRDYIAEIAHASPLNDFINIYGTADAAVLGHETPISIILRKVFDTTSGVRKHVFGQERLPSFMQYYPFLRHFEVNEEQELIFTASAGIPLIRYNIHDQGGILDYNQAITAAKELGIDVSDYFAKDASLPKPWQLPFVYLFGRSDFTVVFYGANIYPESIRAALEISDLREVMSGKFTMFTEESSSHDQVLVINVECAAGVKPAAKLTQVVKNSIIQKLLELNYEYGVVHNSRGKKAEPIIKLYPNGHNKYFRRGVKHRWTLQSS